MSGARTSSTRAGDTPMNLVMRILAGLAVLFIGVPLMALLLAAPWSELGHRLADAWEPVRLSLITSTISSIVAAIVGVPLGWYLARTTGWRHWLGRGLMLVPIVLPPVVSGIALGAAFGRAGLFGRWGGGASLAFSTPGVVVAVLFVSLPFVVLAAEAGFRQVDEETLEMAAVHGMRPAARFWRVAVPAAAATILAGVALSWSRALGEFGATITFAGNRPGVTQTLPLAVFLGLDQGLDQAVALSLVAVALAVGAAGLVRLARR